MGGALLGMVGFQLYWIDSVITANEERFHKDVMQAINNVALKLEKQETVAAFNKFQRLNEIKPQRSSGRKRSFMQSNPLTVDQAKFASHTNPRRRSNERVVVMDTMIDAGFQVIFNYEFQPIPYII